MKRATTVVLALGALVGAGMQPAQAQVVIGGSDKADVEVNWSVIDSLGRAPTLPDMLKADGAGRAQATSPQAKQRVQYRPYKTDKVIKKVADDRAKAKVPAVPAVAKAEPAAAEPVEAAKAVAPASPKVETPAKVEAPVKAEARPAMPPKPEIAAAVEPPKPIELKPEPVKPEPVKPESAKNEPPKMVAKVEPVPAPAPVPVALPPAPVVAKAEPAPLPAPAPVPAPASTPAPVAGAVMNGDTLSVLFTGENAKLPEGVRADLDKVARRLEKDEALGLQLLAYAGGDEAAASKARRLSLTRALEVRKYLMEQGVRSTRIEVRALGNKVDKGPSDRVDAVLISR